MNKIIYAEAELKAIESKYQSEMFVLQNKCDSLENELDQTKVKLSDYKFKLGISKNEVLNSAKKDTIGKTVTERLSDCDSLKKQVIDFVAIVDSTTCTYETAIYEYEDLLATQTKQIVICDSSFLQVKNLMEENLMRERKLTQDLQTAYKQQRRKKLQNKLLAGGILILSGISTTLYINANK
ncbi:MAG: hypothetical protein ACT4ON_13200 [Bacteroidota bacterium]